MLRKTFTLVLFGVLLVGTGTVAYGTFFDKGFAASIAGVTGNGEDDDDDDHGDERRRYGGDRQANGKDEEEDDD